MKISCLLLLTVFPALAADPFTDALTALRKVGPEGQGNAAASAAWPVIAEGNPAQLPSVLAAMADTSAVAKNWLQSAALALAQQASEKPESLPKPALETFLSDHSHDPLARSLAYEILTGADPALPEKLLPTLLDDPSPKLRRMAVQRLVDQAKAAAADKPAATALYTQALKSARDEDQVKGIAEELKGLGQPPDLVKHFGFFTQYQIIGPFTNAGRKGYDTVFPPEKELNFAATYPGLEGDVGWKSVTVTDPLGVLDFNKELKKLKEVTAYAAFDYTSKEGGPAELRIGTHNAYKIWLNGALVFGRDEYHRGFRIDQYKLPVTLKAGKNTVLVKCCQNEETQPWTEEWHFQLRACDANGTPL